MRSPFQTLRGRRRSRGFSLLEVTVALGLLAITIATIIQLYSVNLKSIRKAEAYTQATIIARSFMDEAISSEVLEESNDTNDIVSVYTVNTQVARIEGEEEDLVDTFAITVTVTWQGGTVELKSHKSILKEENEE